MYKLVVVDDETQTRDALCDFFPWEQLGFEIVARFENGRSALEYLKNFPCDVLLTDIVMPIMSGLQLIKELQIQKLLPLTVILSGYRDFEYARQAMCCGIRNYILKPTKYHEIVEIFERIRDALDEEHLATDFLLPAPEAEASEELGYHEKLIQTVKDHVYNNCRDASLDTASQTVSMNPAYLSLLFKQVTGENFSSFLMSVKMKKAAELLGDPNLRISDIGDLLGYSNPNSFARAFKLFYGIGPRNYRFKD